MARQRSSSSASPVDLIPGYDPAATAGDCWFDEKAAGNAILFIETALKHVKGEKAGQPFILEPWQRAIIAALFGWKRQDGTRRYREAFIYIPRKNGKTTLSAAIVLTILFTDGEAGAEIYSAAAEREQAALVFSHASGMVRQNATLDAACKIYSASKAIVIESMNSSYRVLSADAGTKHGLNVHCAVIDELHAHKNRDLVDVLQSGTGARRQPLIVHITTADFARPSICNEKLDYARKVRDGIIEDPSFLPVIYEASATDDDWADEKLWRRVNPNLGVSLSWDHMRHEFAAARETPAYENTFKRLHLNMVTEQDVRWLPMDAWDECDGAVVESEFAGRTCFAGLDLSATTDITALCLAFPIFDGHMYPRGDHPPDSTRYDLLFRFWSPKDTAEKRERKDRVPYLTWAQQGLMTLTPGNVVDYEYIRRDLNALAESFQIEELAVDPWNAMHLMTLLQGDGFNVTAMRQGFASLSGPSKEFEKAVVGRQLRHGGHPIMRWMASNVAVEQDAAGNIKPSKRKSSEKIDGVVAAVMAVGRAAATAQTTSVYETRGVLVGEW